MSRENKKSKNRSLTGDWLSDQQRRYHFFLDSRTRELVVSPKADQFPGYVKRSNL